MNDLKHIGILGMKWGRRQTRNLSPSSRHLSKKGGKTSIVTKNFNGKIVRRKAASPKEVKKFLDERKKQKLSLLQKSNERRKRIAMTYIIGMSALTIAQIAIPKIAWATGKVVSISPLR